MSIILCKKYYIISNMKMWKFLMYAKNVMLELFFRLLVINDEISAIAKFTTVIFKLFDNNKILPWASNK